MRSIVNDKLFYGIAAILAFSLIPLGSNRPFFWTLNGALIAGAALFFVAVRGPRRRSPVALRRLAIPGALIAIATLWMAVQLVPLPEAGLPDAWARARAALPADLAAGSISLDPAATVGMIIRYLSYALLFLLAVQVGQNRERGEALIMLIFWVAVAEAAFALFALFSLGDTVLFTPKWAYKGYATGTFVNRNSLATFLGFGVVLGVVLLLDALGLLGRFEPGRRRSSLLRWDEATKAVSLYGAGLLVLISAIVLSGSRMGAAATGAGVVTVFVTALVRPRSRRLSLTAGLMISALAVAAVLVFSGASLIERLGSVESSADQRLLLYRQVLAMIEARPWTGYGGGAFADAFQSFHRLPLSADVTWDAAHNLYLELFADLGIFGAAPILAVVWVFSVIVVGAVRRQRAVASTAATGVVVLAALHSTVDFSLQIEANVLTFVAILGTGFAEVLRPVAGSGRASQRPMPAPPRATAPAEEVA